MSKVELVAMVNVPPSVPAVQPRTPPMIVLELPRRVPEVIAKTALLLTVIGPSTSKICPLRFSPSEPLPAHSPITRPATVASTSIRQVLPPVLGISTMSPLVGARLRSQLEAVLQLTLPPPTLIQVIVPGVEVSI